MFLNRGEVNLIGGTTALGEYRQISGVTKIDSATLKSLNPYPVQIRNGSLVGTGTIDGNLVLGYDPAQPGWQPSSPGISPGIGVEGIGRIDVTGAFHMFSDGSLLAIDLNAQGQMDLIAVNEYAVVNGTALIYTNTNYQPAGGTRATFLTYNELVNQDNLWVELFPAWSTFTWVNGDEHLWWDFYHTAVWDPNPHATSWWIYAGVVG